MSSKTVNKDSDGIRRAAKSASSSKKTSKETEQKSKTSSERSPKETKKTEDKKRKLSTGSQSNETQLQKSPPQIKRQKTIQEMFGSKLVSFSKSGEKNENKNQTTKSDTPAVVKIEHSDQIDLDYSSSPIFQGESDPNKTFAPKKQKIIHSPTINFKKENSEKMIISDDVGKSNYFQPENNKSLKKRMGIDVTKFSKGFVCVANSRKPDQVTTNGGIWKTKKTVSCLFQKENINFKKSENFGLASREELPKIVLSALSPSKNDPRDPLRLIKQTWAHNFTTLFQHTRLSISSCQKSRNENFKNENENGGQNRRRLGGVFSDKSPLPLLTPTPTPLLTPPVAESAAVDRRRDQKAAAVGKISVGNTQNLFPKNENSNFLHLMKISEREGLAKHLRNSLFEIFVTVLSQTSPDIRFNLLKNFATSDHKTSNDHQLRVFISLVRFGAPFQTIFEFIHSLPLPLTSSQQPLSMIKATIVQIYDSKESPEVSDSVKFCISKQKYLETSHFPFVLSSAKALLDSGRKNESLELLKEFAHKNQNCVQALRLYLLYLHTLSSQREAEIATVCVRLMKFEKSHLALFASFDLIHKGFVFLNLEELLHYVILCIDAHPHVPTLWKLLAGLIFKIYQETQKESEIHSSKAESTKSCPTSICQILKPTQNFVENSKSKKSEEKSEIQKFLNKLQKNENFSTTNMFSDLCKNAKKFKFPPWEIQKISEFPYFKKIEKSKLSQVYSFERVFEKSQTWVKEWQKTHWKPKMKIEDIHDLELEAYKAICSVYLSGGSDFAAKCFLTFGELGVFENFRSLFAFYEAIA